MLLRVYEQLNPVWAKLTTSLESAGSWVGLLLLRLLLAWEFYEAGIIKLNSKNWFASVKENFPFPFNLVSTDISWFLATWFEILGGIGLAIGLFTRFWSFSLIILTIVAILGVHWPAEWSSFSELWKGYAITDNGYGNYKLPLLFICMLIPLLLSGAGKLSIDYWINRFFQKAS